MQSERGQGHPPSCSRRTIFSAGPPCSENSHAGCHFPQATSRPASGEISGQKMHTENCESRKTCLKANATCAQNAF